MQTRALVIGGTNGIGYAMARRVAASSSSTSVTICGRTMPSNLPDNIEFQRLEASSMRQIKKFTDAFKKSLQERKLDILIMTQGVMTFEGRLETPEGIDRKMALDYYGRQLLVREMTPILEENAWVIFVLNGKESIPSHLNWNDLDMKNAYTVWGAAKQAAVMLDISVQHYAALQKAEGTGRRHYIHAYPGGGAAKVLGPLIAVTPDTCAEYLMIGIDKATAEGEKAGRFWSNIDNKGQLIENKTIWSKDQMETLASHTWKLIDAALNTKD
ncbi:hypothetical protein DPV78_011854 [Talaromyces pinophilus]|nr:hypothetical protein DPV78_011854 [Talaromyces pinophilus]